MKIIFTKFWNTTIRSSFILGLVALALCSLLLVACGDNNADLGYPDDNPTSPASTVQVAAKINPCDLVTQAEFDRIWGIKTGSAEEVESLSQGYDSSCDYDSPHLLVSLFVNRAGKISSVTHQDNNATFDSLRKIGKDIVDVPNLGDKAMWDARFEQLLVVKHNVLLMVNITEGKPDHSPAGIAEKQARSIALVQQALVRIP